MELLQFHTLLLSALEEVSAEYDATAALSWEKASFIWWIGGSWVPHGQSGEFGKGKRFLSPSDIHSTNARLSSHYPIYCNNSAICSNTYEIISWLSRMFINCWFTVKLTAKKIFFPFYQQSTKTLRPFNRFSCSCTDVMWGALAKVTAGPERRDFPIVTRWMISKLVKTKWQSELWDWNC